jgi:hypothetical protein
MPDYVVKAVLFGLVSLYCIGWMVRRMYRNWKNDD